jgi:hypothetical protein
MTSPLLHAMKQPHRASSPYKVPVYLALSSSCRSYIHRPSGRRRSIAVWPFHRGRLSLRHMRDLSHMVLSNKCAIGHRQSKGPLIDSLSRRRLGCGDPTYGDRLDPFPAARYPSRELGCFPSNNSIAGFQPGLPKTCGYQDSRQLLLRGASHPAAKAPPEDRRHTNIWVPRYEWTAAPPFVSPFEMPTTVPVRSP